jgi:hypothetical protein
MFRLLMVIIRLMFDEKLKKAHSCICYNEISLFTDSLHVASYARCFCHEYKPKFFSYIQEWILILKHNQQDATLYNII